MQTLRSTTSGTGRSLRAVLMADGVVVWLWGTARSDEGTLGLVDLFIGITEILSPEDKVCLPITLLDLTSKYNLPLCSVMPLMRQILRPQPDFKLKSSSED